MATAEQKLVKVGDDIIAFPSDLEDAHVAKLIKSFREKKKKQPLATEESERQRQLKPAQPLSTVIPSLPSWATSPLPEPTPTTPLEKFNVRQEEKFRKSHPNIGAVEKGVEGFVEGMSSPVNLALLMGAPESKLLSAFFTVQALRGSYKDAKSAQKAFMEGKNADAIQYATQALLGAGIGALAGTHAYKGLPEGVRTRLESEEGSVGPQNAELKPTPAYKAVDQSQPFYLKSENLVSQKMKGPMPASDLHKMLLSNGVKPDEMEWTGLDEFLKGKGKEKVTPQEVQEQLAGSNLQVKEVMHGDPNTWTEEDSRYYEALEHRRYSLTEQERIDFQRLQERANRLGSPGKLPETPKFGTYTLPGAEPGSYRELLLTMPPKMSGEAEARRIMGEEVWARIPRHEQEQLARSGGNPAEQQSFHSAHWDEPNVLGHVRFNDRVGPNGERILHVEEIQSDWAQKSRKQGFKNPKRESELKAQIDSIKKKYDVGGTPSDVRRWREEGVSDDEIDKRLNDKNLTYDQYEKMRSELRPLETELDKMQSALPPMPFSKTWPELLLKRMVKYAVDHGYDGISWTPGEEQAARYDLSKNVETIRYYPGSGLLQAFEKGGGARGRMIIDEKVPTEKLPDYIGKEAAQKLVEQKEGFDPYTESGGSNVKILNNADLKVGGKGMIGFYDKIIPDAANKLGKKWGAKVGETQINVPENRAVSEYRYEIQDSSGTVYLRTNDEGAATQSINNYRKSSPNIKFEIKDKGPEKINQVKVPYLPITPQMRTGVKSIPFSLFSVPLAAGALSLAQVKEQADKLKKGASK